MSGAEIAAQVAAAMGEAGAETGNGEPLIAYMIRSTGAVETVYPPVPGEDVSYSTTALVSNYSARDRDGTQITARDVKLMLAVPLADSEGNETEPKNGDTIALSDARVLHVVDVKSLQPGGVVLYWVCQARSGDT